MVDALPDRGAADALIAPLRPRLAQLRPARPISFTRLVFTPLNPVIMPMAEWRRSGLGIPRSTLSVLGRALRAELPGFAGIQADSNTIGVAGLTLWPAAAAALDALAMPPDWFDATGLVASEFAGMARLVAAVLHEAPSIDRLAGKRQPLTDGEIWPVLSRSKARGAAALDTVVCVLLARLPDPARVAALATEAAGGDRATGRAIDRLAASVSGATSEGADLREAAVEASRVVAMLDALAHGATAERRIRLDHIRREADALSRHCFDHSVSRFLDLTQQSMAGTFDDCAVAAIESFCPRSSPAGNRLAPLGRR